MQVSVEKYFNTWNCHSPAVMEFLPMQLGICPGLYSEAQNAATSLPFTDNVRLCEHQKDGNYVNLFVRHAGTDLQIEYAKADQYTVLGRIRAVKKGEWGLRFWVNLALGLFGKDGTLDGFCAERNGLFAYAAFTEPPLRTARTREPYSEGEKMARQSYYAPELDEPDARWTVAKFNLEQTPEIVFAVGIASEAELAAQKAKGALLHDMDALKTRAFAHAVREEGEFPSAAGAIRDVMAWNTVFDWYNMRPVTVATRNWIEKKYGGWYVPLNDTLYNALICLISGDAAMARHNILAALSNACPEGNLAGIMSAYTKSADRSKPPIAAYVVFKYYLFTGDATLLATAYKQLKRSFYWWVNCRRTPSGMFAYGSSNLGKGHFVGTRTSAMSEAAMDNSPMYDHAVYDEKTGVLDMDDVALCSLLVVEAEHLELMAQMQGFEQDAQEFRAFYEELKRGIDERLYDESRGIYANRKRDGTFSSLSPTSFFPMAAGVPTGERMERLIEHLFDPDEFMTYAPLPSVPANDPAAHDNVYWRGRMWPSINFLTFIGLRRMGQDEAAYQLIKRSMEIFDVHWKNERKCYENYDTFNGEGNSVDSDPYYGCGALLPMMWILGHVDVDPHNGINFAASTHEAFQMLNLPIRGRRFVYCVDAHDCTLELGDKVIFKLRGASGRIRNVVVESHFIGFTIDAQKFKGADVYLPNVQARMILANGEPVDLGTERMKLPAGQPVKIEVWY